MSMMRFGLLFPEVAERETRTVKVFEALPTTNPRQLPVDEYGFDELYCDERSCDCRRVMINVLARQARQHVATINHAFEKPTKDDPVPEQTFLDPLNQQSPLAAALLDLFVNLVLADEDYRQRLVRHYRMFKNVVEDAAHPAHRLLHLPEGAAGARGRSIPPPPPRRGKRKKWQ
jgi:hypothetical protein